MHLLRLTARSIVVAAALAATPAFAAIYTVGSGAGCTHATIQAAIDAADTVGSTGADEIRLSGGPYTGQALTMHIAAAHGAIVLNGGFATCTSAAPTAGARTVVGGRSGADPVLRISDTADATLRNLEIRDADGGSGLAVETNSGGITSSSITLVDTLVAHSHTSMGGGILLSNYNPASLPERLQLRLQGNTEIAYNLGHVRGGGLYCRNASVELSDSASIHDNIAGSAGFAGSLDGGGIYATDCQLAITSSTPQGVLYRNTAALAGRGGGLYITGTGSLADFYPVTAGSSVIVTGNRALEGGGIAIAGGAQVRMFGSSGLFQNVGDQNGGALWLAPGGSAGVDTRFLLQSTLDGAPQGAAACVGSVCGWVLDNSTGDGSGAVAPGAALYVAAGDSGTAHATFRGSRISQNQGYSLITQDVAHSGVVLDGSLVVENTISGGAGAFAAIAATDAFVLSASTVANNVFTDATTPVFFIPTTCDPANDDVGTHLRRSIVWQPGHALQFALFESPQAECFRHLIANDFGLLGSAADRVVADPAFANVAGGDYGLAATSPALDFAPASAADATLDAGPRVIDLPAITNLFGPQDLGALERTYSPTVTASVVGTGGTITPSSQSVQYGHAAEVAVFPFGGWQVVTPVGGDCPQGTLNTASYKTGPITAPCAIAFSFIHTTTIALGSGAPVSVFGQSVTFTATLAATSPTGSVTFRDGANVLGTAPLSGPSANFTTTALGVGAHSITASYAGDASNTAATSPAFAQTVNRAASTTTIVPTTSIHLGQATTVVATVVAASPGAGTPSGTIDVLVGFTSGSGGCTITLPAASCALTPSGETGLLTLSANYSGDSNFSASVGTQTLQVTPQFVGGGISGLSAEQLMLRLSIDGEQAQLLTAPAGANGFTFSHAVPVGAHYTVNVATHPPGLFCAVTNGSGTMPAGDVGDVAIACSDAPHAILALAVNDGIAFARYGQTLVYTVTVGNTGTAGASGVGVAATASPGLDAPALGWSCVASGGASCGAGGVGGLSDSANVPINDHVTYTVTVPVLAATGEPTVRLEVRANAGEAIASDSDTLVLLRDGFDGR